MAPKQTCFTRDVAVVWGAGGEKSLDLRGGRRGNAAANKQGGRFARVGALCSSVCLRSSSAPSSFSSKMLNFALESKPVAASVKNGIGDGARWPLSFFFSFFSPAHSIAGGSLTQVASVLAERSNFEKRGPAFFGKCAALPPSLPSHFKESLCAFSGYRGELRSKIAQQSQAAAAPDHQGPPDGALRCVSAAWAAAASL